MLGAVSAIAAVQTWLRRPAAGGIKSIQRGVITLAAALTGTATITAVDPLNSVVSWCGASGSDATLNSTFAGYCGLSLTNSTTVTATRTNATGTALVSFEVIEYQPGVLKSVQRGIKVFSGVTTVTITAVNVAKTQTTVIGFQGDGNAFTASVSTISVVLTNSTTLTFAQSNAAATCALHWQVIEFN